MNAPFNRDAVALSQNGWLNATKSANSENKKPGQFFSSRSTHPYINSVSEEPAFCINGEFVKSVKDEDNDLWIHPTLKLSFKRWCDPNFAVSCDMLLYKQLFRNPPNLESAMLSIKGYSGSILDLIEGEDSRMHQLLNLVMESPFDSLKEEELTESELKSVPVLKKANNDFKKRGFNYDKRRFKLKMLLSKALNLVKPARDLGPLIMPPIENGKLTKINENKETLIHPILAVNYARWLDVNFAIWCDLKTADLLARKKI